MIPILYLSNYRSFIGGGEQQLYYLVSNLDKDKFKPIVVCPKDGTYVTQLRKADIPTVVLKLPPWRKTLSYPIRHIAAVRLANLTKKNRIKLIHSADPWLNPYVKRVRKQLNIPSISHVPNLLTPEQVEKYAFESMNHIIAISQKSKEPLVNAGITTEKIDVITNCVDLTLFQPVSTRNKTDADLFIVGIVGRIEPFKRQTTFIDIAKEVHQHCSNVRFHIIGSSFNIPKFRDYENEVRQLVLENQLEDVVYFLGHRNDMPKAMCELDLLVTLSAGSVIAEAMACAKPVIGTSIGSTADMVLSSETGYILPENAIEEIVDKIVLLIKDPERCFQMGIAARRHAEKNFSIEKYVQNVQQVYEILLD